MLKFLNLEPECIIHVSDQFHCLAMFVQWPFEITLLCIALIAGVVTSSAWWFHLMVESAQRVVVFFISPSVLFLAQFTFFCYKQNIIRLLDDCFVMLTD